MSNKTGNEEANWWGGMYVKRVNNLTDSSVYFTIREYPNKSFALEAGERKKPTDFPLPWVSNAHDEGKCILIEISDANQEILLWDDKASGAYFTKNGQWDPQAKKVFGNASSWGDYELTISGKDDIKMQKMA